VVAMLPKIQTGEALSDNAAPTADASTLLEPGGPETRDLREARQGSSASLASVSSSASNTSKSQPPVHHRTSSSSSNPPSLSVKSHRQSLSFADELRNVPSSPRHRQPSVTQIAVQELLNNPPSANRQLNPRFAGRDWRSISVGELSSPDDVKWVGMNTSVEEATKVLLKSQSSVVLIHDGKSPYTAVSTFDYSDLNAYLLLVIGLAKPEPGQLELFNTIIHSAQEGKDIPLRDIQSICRQDPLIHQPFDESLSQAIEVLGSGIHRVLVTAPDGKVTGIVSQLRVLDFFWNEGINFPSIHQLYPTMLKDLGVGTQHIVSVNSDAPLSEALTLMNEEGLTSIAVVDNGYNVVGNISARDVRHLTSTASAPLLSGTCMHFISVILNERGVEKGRDAVPVFYVNPYSTLAHTVAKLVATRAHRMWVVESSSPSPSAPATPLNGPQPPIHAGLHTPTAPPTVPTSPLPPPGPQASIPASAMAGSRISGKLNGVISLTDILNVFAKFSGLHPTDPNEQRARRRRSSSSSMRPSGEFLRANSESRR
jgi:CBS domain-containing protein